MHKSFVFCVSLLIFPLSIPAQTYEEERSSPTEIIIDSIVLGKSIKLKMPLVLKCIPSSAYGVKRTNDGWKGGQYSLKNEIAFTFKIDRFSNLNAAELEDCSSIRKEEDKRDKYRRDSGQEVCAKQTYVDKKASQFLFSCLSGLRAEGPYFYCSLTGDVDDVYVDLTSKSVISLPSHIGFLTGNVVTTTYSCSTN